MNKKIINIATLAALILTGASATAQVTHQKVGDNPMTINPNALLELESTNKGLLLPRVTLSATDNFAPLTAHVEGITVYNTATAGTAPNNVTPGYYYNDGAKWVRIAANTDINPVNIYNTNGTLTSARTLTLGGFPLNFTGTEQTVTLNSAGWLGIDAQGANSSFMRMTTTDGNANGTKSSFDMQLYPDNMMQMFATDEVSKISFGTHETLNSAPIEFVTSPGGSASGEQRMIITGEGNIGISTPSPTEKLDVADGNLRIRDINANTGGATDNIVVADATGVLKTIDVASISTPETNTTLSIAAGQLVYANEDADNANVNLISADIDNAITTGTDGSLFGKNIYNANGSITGSETRRTLTLNGKELTFNGTQQRTYWSANGSMNQSNQQSGTGHASISLYGGNDSNLFIQQFYNSNAQISIGGNSTSLDLSTHKTVASAPITFSTSIGSNADAIEKMRITGEGNIGINTITPANKLHIVGDGTANPVRIEGLQTGVATDNIVVADATGALKTVAATDIAPVVTTNNGITKNVTTSEIELGGTLTRPTTITQGGNDLTIAAESSNFIVSGLDKTTVQATVNGATTTGITDHLLAVGADNTVKALKAAMPKFFYMPSIIVPTSQAQLDAPSSGKVAGDVFDDVTLQGTINLYGRYQSQFGTTGTATQPSSPGAPVLPVLPASELNYYVTWYDTSVFTLVAVNATGELTYTVDPNADITVGSFMNIVFSVKED